MKGLIRTSSLRRLLICKNEPGLISKYGTLCITLAKQKVNEASDKYHIGKDQSRWGEMHGRNRNNQNEMKAG